MKADLSPVRIVRRRQTTFFVTVFLLFGVGGWLLWRGLQPGGMDLWKWATLVVFAPLFLQLCFGAVVAAAGFLVSRRGGDPLLISRLPAQKVPGPGSADRPGPPTAVLMPIFNEDVPRVFQGIRQMFESLAATGRGRDFDFFILSDSNDPNHWIDEEMAWVELCKQVRGFGRIFYRKRRIGLHHKSGNIADFCRRWGAKYRYMIVLDADSIMTGEAMVRLVGLMEGRPSAGIIQTHPRQVLARSLFGRIQQFAAHTYAPLFLAGSNYWHLAGGSYWGHNAILRISPFIQHCALPELPPTGPFTGRFLSHDSVEAALMRAAGYGVWLAYDVEGSYEEGPPDVLAALERDRRWCLGNLQHVTLLLKRGFRSESRIHLLLGIMAYLAAPLWLAFILLTVGRTALKTSDPTVVPGDAVPLSWLFALVLFLLLTPKFLGWLHARNQLREGPTANAPGKLAAGVVLETLFSTLLAPVQMLSHTQSVLAALFRIPTRWTTQNRGDERPGWGETFRRQGVPAGLAILSGWACWNMAPASFAWLTPVLVGLILAAPIARLTSSPQAGETARRRGLFVIPEETDPPSELQNIPHPGFRQNPFFRTGSHRALFGLLQVVLDPYVNAVHVALLRSRSDQPEQATSAVVALSNRLISDGPGSLSPREVVTLLWNAEALVALHQELWCAEPGTLSDEWIEALHQYGEATELTTRRGMA